MTFRITSTLTPAQRQRVNRAADHFQTIDQNDPTMFFRSGRNTYSMIADGDIHAAARRAMLIAGLTFDYEIVS